MFLAAIVGSEIPLAKSTISPSEIEFVTPSVNNTRKAQSSPN